MPRNPIDEVLSDKRVSGDGAPAPPSGWSGWGTSLNEGTSGLPVQMPAKPDYLDGIPAADWHPPQRKKDKRKRKKSRWIPLIKSNKKAVEKRAAALGVPAYELVRYLLEYGLGAVQTGELVLEPQLEPAGLTLYPAEMRARQRRPQKVTLVNASYRGIPNETWDQIKELARSVPTWQVANRLIEYGLAQIDAGRLRPQPQNVGVRTLY